MLNLENLKQLIAFAECGTLSAAADRCHVSQPTITRTMQAVEEDFGVPLFMRSKNRISLNDTGRLAVEHARTVLASADNAYRIVRAYDKSKHTIQVESCAPAPLWSLLPRLTNLFPDMSLSSDIIADSDKIISDVLDGSCNLGITIYPPEKNESDVYIQKYMDESLSICLPNDHELVRQSQNPGAGKHKNKTAVTFNDLNGYNCLLRSQLGFWAELVYKKMPASKFLVQKDDFAMAELIRKTTLPFFVTDVSRQTQDYAFEGRTILPIKDTEASVSYYLITMEKSYI